MKEWFQLVTKIIKEEVNSKEVREEVLKPLFLWFCWYIVPYILLILGLNFFMTIAAMCLVLYFRK